MELNAPIFILQTQENKNISRLKLFSCVCGNTSMHVFYIYFCCCCALCDFVWFFMST